MTPFAQISLIIFLGASLGAIVALIKQPPLVGYVIAGIIVGIMGLGAEAMLQVETMSEFGITLLLFLVGMELSFSDLRAIGKPALIVGFTQIILSFLFGFALNLLLGIDRLTSLYLGIALSFSSTVIVVKLLTEKHALESLYGKIAVGILLVQDFVAIITLILLGGMENYPSVSFLPLLVVLLKGAMLLGLTIFLSKIFFPSFMRLVALSPEMIFVTSLAWALGFATLVSLPPVGFSIEIGGFLAGLALANSQQHYQIMSRIRPLRDFFLTVFFVILGVRLAAVDVGSILLTSLILTIFVLISHSLIILLVMSLLGYRKRTSFYTALSLSQISEFGLIIMSVGEKIGHVSELATAIVVIVAALSMTVSTYIILHIRKLYQVFLPIVSFFERKVAIELPQVLKDELNDHIVLMGYNRTGKGILAALKRQGKRLVVVDFNPAIIEHLLANGIEAVYGDIADHELMEHLALDKAAIVISTIPSVEDNLAVLERIQQLENKPLVIMTAAYPQEALTLYEKKADFVLIPHLVGAEHLSHLINAYGLKRERFHSIGQQHFYSLVSQWGERGKSRESIFFH